MQNLEEFKKIKTAIIKLFKYYYFNQLSRSGPGFIIGLSEMTE